MNRPNPGSHPVHVPGRSSVRCVRVPIFVYRCGCGQRFERLVPRDAEAPSCPECGSATRKVPAGPSLGRGVGAADARRAAHPTGAVPIPWRGVVDGGPEKIKREVEFRQRLETKAMGGLRTPGGPDSRPTAESGGTSSPAGGPSE
jgi:putative FmdB family regulatory protein